MNVAVVWHWIKANPKLVIAALALTVLLFLGARTVERLKYTDHDFPKTSDLTIVTELSTYNASKNDLKTRVAELAIQSWLFNTNNVLVLVESEDICSSLTRKFPLLRCVRHHCNHQDFNIPTVPCLMMTGESLSSTKYILFTNGDISFGPIQPTLTKVARTVPNFVLAGQRIDVHTSRVPESHVTSVKDLLTLALSEGELHGESAIDYFVYTRTESFARKMPPFLIGNWKWDNWLLHDFIVSEQTTVVDATSDICAVHVGATSTALAQRRGAVYNSRVFESSTFGIQGIGMGSLKFVDAVVYRGQVLENHDLSVAWTKFIFSLAKASETLVVVTVPCGFTSLLSNWLLWAQKAGLKSFIVFPMDIDSLTFAKSHNLPIPPMQEQLLRNRSFSCDSRLARSPQELLIQRNYLLRNISQAGLGFVSLSVNTILLEPFPFSAIRTKEIFGQRLDENASSSAISDGLWGVPAAYSKSGVKLLRGVIGCQEMTLNRSSDWRLSTYTCSRDVASTCLNAEIERSFPDSLSILGDQFVAGARSAFVQYRLQRRGVYPAVLHQDSGCSAAESEAILRKWNFLLGQDRFGEMLPFSAPVPTTSPDGNARAVSMFVRVLAMGVGTPDNLRNLLASLERADFGDDEVDVEVHIDAPAPGAGPQDARNYQGIQQLARSFRWPRGSYTVVDSGTHRGHFDMFVQGFKPRREGQVMLLLEDSNELSPSFYQWVRAALAHFKPHDDSRLYGIALQRQHSVVGLQPEQRYGRSYIDLRVDPTRVFFRYQLLSSWGTVLFPHHWNAFVQWAKEVRRQDPQFQPCIPFFYSNGWIIKKQPHFWSVWFNYYAYMNGLYSLYINYARFDGEDGKRYSLFRSQRHSGSQLHLLNEPAPKMFLPSASYPLYDFHLNLVGNAQLLSDRWRIVSGVDDKCLSNHGDKRLPVHVSERKKSGKLQSLQS